MSTRIKLNLNRTVFETLLLVGFLAGIAEATAQMTEPWAFKTRDRAGLAVIQKQVDEGLYSRSNSSTGVVGSAGSAGQTLLYCGGGGGTSSATSNSSCIILNNTTGNLSVGQDSQGDQSAETTSDTTIGEVEEILNQSGGPGSDIPATGN